MLGKRKYQELLSSDRKARKTKFVAIREEILRVRLPANAFLILVHLLDHSETYMPSRKQLSKESGLGRTAIDRALVELQKQNIIEIEYGANNSPKYRLNSIKDWKANRSPARSAASSRNLRKGVGAISDTVEFKYKTVFTRHHKKIKALVLKSSVKNLLSYNWTLPTVVANNLTCVELCSRLDPVNSKLYNILAEDWTSWIESYLSDSSLENILLLPRVLAKNPTAEELAKWCSYLDGRLTNIKAYLLSFIKENPTHQLTNYRKRLIRLFEEMTDNYSTSEMNALTDEALKIAFLKDAESQDVFKLLEAYAVEESACLKVWEECLSHYQKEFPESK